MGTILLLTVSVCNTCLDCICPSPVKTPEMNLWVPTMVILGWIGWRRWRKREG